MKFKILTIFFLLLFLSSTVYLAKTHVESFLANKINLEMSSQVKEFDMQEPQEVEQEEQEILPEFLALYEKNPEFAGWLKIENTRIDFPVMKPTKDNDFYLSHGADGSRNDYGAIYMDVASNLCSSSTNFLLYGHNFRDGSMFGTLKKYKDETYYQEHPTIKFDTLYEKGEYQIISVFTSKVYKKNDTVFKYYQYTDIESKKEFDEYVSGVKKLSLYDIQESAEYGDSLLTLSTCDSWVENGRIAVVAKKIKP